MDEKEIQKLMDGLTEKVKGTVKTEVEAATAGLMKSDELASKLEALGLKDNAIKTLTDAVTKQGEELRKIIGGGGKADKKSLDELIEMKANEIKSLATSNRGGETVKIDLSEFAVQKTQVTRASVSQSTQAMRLAEIGQLPYMGTVMSGMFRHAQVSPDSNGVIRYMDQNSITRNAATVAEGGTKPESAITWIERTLEIKKIADSIPVTKEAFKDVLFIKSEIERLLNINLALKEDEQLYAGDGLTSNLTGLVTSAPAFVTTPYDDSVDNANLYDLLAVLRVDVMTARQSKYAASHVLMNPIDILKYKLKKATDGHYILPPFISANGAVIDGMSVVESNQVTANSLVVGDFRFGTIYDLEGVTIEMGWVNDQFIKNAMTILAEKRLGLLIRNVDVTAFRKVTDINAAIAALETP